MSDKKYLFKRNNVWWVKLAVPLSLRSELGYDLRRTTGETDLDKAIPIRDKIIEDLGKKGAKKILVFSPAFVADCLETTIEIGDEYQELFEEFGGEKVQLVESLNSSDTFVKGLKEMILKRSI